MIKNTSFQRRMYSLAIMGMVIMLLSGCAERFGQRSQNVIFETDPSEAIVSMNGKLIGTTPAVVFLPIKNSYREVREKLQLLKNGYIDQEEFDDFVNLVHKIIITKDGFETVYLELKAKPFHKDAPNKALCIFDAIYSPIFLFMPAAVDFVNGACNGFQRAHQIKLRSKDENSRVISIGHNRRSIGLGLGR